MIRQRIRLSSDQLELLLAFEECHGLNHLAETMAKDPSVVSRGLQKIAEEYPVLVKVKGRWELTPVGYKMNALTKKFIEQQSHLLDPTQIKRPSGTTLSNHAALIVINAQIGLLDATQLGRNNLEAEKNIARLLAHWRSKKMPIVHVKHISENPSSIFYRHSQNCEFLPAAAPLQNELIVEKTKSSSFHETTLEANLKKMEPKQIVLVGFTANECIDATARDSTLLEFATFVVADATAMFDMKTPDGKLIKADRLHRLTMTNLNAFYAKVISTSDIVSL